MKTTLRVAALITLYLPMMASADGPRVFQAAEVLPFAGGDATGAAWLKRTEDRVDGRVMTGTDMANVPYTVWWIVFNEPGECMTSPCSDADFANGGAAAEIAVFNAGGAVSAASGELNQNGKPAGSGVINLDISVVTGEGAGNGSQMGPPVPPFMRNFEAGNGLKAEIHLVIDKHIFDTDWVTELTYPDTSEAFAIFLPVDND